MAELPNRMTNENLLDAVAQSPGRTVEQIAAGQLETELTDIQDVMTQLKAFRELGLIYSVTPRALRTMEYRTSTPLWYPGNYPRAAHAPGSSIVGRDWEELS